jgi:hypothetical protein
VKEGIPSRLEKGGVSLRAKRGNLLIHQPRRDCFVATLLAMTEQNMTNPKPSGSTKNTESSRGIC